ncbi:hypothetical protein [Mesorhizobium loti]
MQRTPDLCARHGRPVASCVEARVILNLPAWSVL